MLKTGTESWSKPGGNRGASSSDRAPVDARGSAPEIALLGGDLDRDRPAAGQVRADDDGVDPRAEIVDVRHRHQIDATLTQRRQGPGGADSLEQVSVAGAVERRRAVLLAEELTLAGQAERHELREPQRLRQASLGDMGTRVRIRGEARHQRHRDISLDRCREPCGVSELPSRGSSARRASRRSP